MQSSNPDTLTLELGTIIQINAPTNPILHERIFIIQYINPSKLSLIDDRALEPTDLTIVDGDFTDESIQSIAILSVPSEKGYARQNNLLPETWIDIHFGGDIPTIITGKINDLEEDMIIISTHPDNDEIFIDFGYHGIPEHLPIEKIKIRDRPITETEQELHEDPSQKKLEPIPEDAELDIDETEAYDASVPLQTTIQLKAKLQSVLTEADEIVWGDIIGTVTQEVAVKEEERRYDIKTQTTDMLNELLSTIPNAERTTKVLNSIHRIISRFTQLRTQFSTRDKDGIISGVVEKGRDYKPLVDKLFNLSSNLYWILPVVKNKRKLYDLGYEDIEDATDIQPLQTSEALTDESALENQYYGNKIPGNQNKYKYLIRGQNRFLTPFTNPDDMSDVISEQRVNADITVLVDNIIDDLEDIYSSVSSCTLVKKEFIRKLQQRRHVIMKYNLGVRRHNINYKRGLNMMAPTTEEHITQSDNANIKSFVFLPEPYVRFSHIQLPNTTIYEKANLNQTYLAYWKLLRKNTSITTEHISKLGADHTYSSDTFLQNITHIVPDVDITDKDTYKQFLQAFMPKTKNLFHLIKKYIQNKTNLVSVVQYLEPFLIYKEDLSFAQYKDIVDFINIHIKNLYAHLATNNKFTNILRSWKLRGTFDASILYTMIELHKASHSNSVMDSYGISKNALPSEVYAQLVTTDYGNLYNSTISLLDSSLYSDYNIVDELSQKIDMLNIEMSDEKKASPCGSLVLSKRYIDYDDIVNDNNKDIVFDVKYDNTRYDIIHEYKAQQESMSAEEFKEYLKLQLQQNIGLSERVSEIDAIAMIQGSRPVVNGDYAVLDVDAEGDGVTIKQQYYYKREGGTWILDEQVTEKMYGSDSNVFCNSINKCLMVKDTCESTQEAKFRLDSNMTQDIIKKMMEEHIVSSEQMVANITKQQKMYATLIQRIKQMDAEHTLQFNNDKYTFGLSAEHEDVVRSPFLHLRNMIIGERDFVKRTYNLRKFIVRFTREPVNSDEVLEDENWLYCTTTNTKLLPTFFKKLAYANLHEYAAILDDICTERGELSNDKDKWVDKYSGYTIRYIDFDTDEGYDEGGFKINTRSAVETDDVTVVASDGVMQDAPVEETKTSRYINNIISLLSDHMGIAIETQRDFVVQSTLNLIHALHDNKEEYEERRAHAKKLGKKNIPNYEQKLDQYILFFTGLFVLVSIQTSIPPIHTTKTYPNCKKSFGGFPISQDGDISGLEYIVCIMKHTSGGSRPWKSIRKMKEDKLVQYMKSIYEKHIQDLPEIKRKMKEKHLYLEEFGDYKPIPTEINVNKWVSFMPPLNKFHLGTIIAIHDLFRQELIRNMKTGKQGQFEKISILQSKLMFVSLKIQELIQNVVDKEPLLLESINGQPFLENVCCDTMETIDCLRYFSSKDDNIIKHNDTVIQLSNLYNDVLRLTMPSILFSSLRTKLQYPVVSKEYNEVTIYQAFIKLCKFNQAIPLTDSIKRVCNNNASAFNNSDTIEQKIATLKSEGHIFNEAAMIELIRIVNQENIIHISVDPTTVSIKRKLETLLDYFEPYERDIPAPLNNALKNLVDTFDHYTDPHSESYDTLLDYLIAENIGFTTTIIDFIERHGNATIRNKNKMKLFMNTFSEFVSLKKSTLTTSEDETTTRTIQFIQNCVRKMATDFPLMIQHKVIFSHHKTPEHWNLSKKHESDISEIISKSYSTLSHNYTVKDIIPLLQHMPERTKHVVMLMNNTPFMASLSLKGESSTDKNTEPIFGSELALELHKYYFLSVMHTYIALATVSPKDVVDMVAADSESDEGPTLAERIADAEQTSVIEHISSLLMDYIQIFTNYKEMINVNETSIMDKLLLVKDTEKNRKVRTLKNLSDEERNVDNQFKYMKLGRWNKGLQKGLTQYVGKTYDEERLELEQDAIIDLRLGEHAAVISMNRDIFKLDEYEKIQRDEEIMREVHDMGGIGDDDELPEGMDGDEI